MNRVAGLRRENMFKYGQRHLLSWAFKITKDLGAAKGGWVTGRDEPGNESCSCFVWALFMINYFLTSMWVMILLNKR